MQRSPVRIVASVLVLAALAAPAAWAQDTVQPLQNAAPPSDAAPPPPSAQPAPIYTPAQLDQLLAPIALYPDQLLGQILMAATYPLEVVQADRWVKDPNNARLKGDQLAAALQPIDWDPSVKSLVPFPQILAMLDQRLDWTQKLGDAFLAQQADVMDSAQRLRQQAQAAGNLRSTAQETVTPVGQTIVIQPANPQVVYVPVYNPTLVYGSWLYPDYPPYYIPPPPGFYYGPPVYSGIGFSIGFGVVRAFWGWDDWDWDHHRLHVDRDRVNVINTFVIEHNHERRVQSDTWEHDPAHRRGVVYRDAAVRQQFRPGPAGAPETRRDFRGFSPQAARLSPARVESQRTAPGRIEPQRAEPQRTTPGRIEPQQAQPQRAAPGRIEQQQAQPQRAAPTRVEPQRTAPGRIERQQAAPATVVRLPPVAARALAAPQRAPAAEARTPPPAFQGFDRGNARQQSERGRASLQAPAPAARAAPAPRQVAPAPAPRQAAPEPARQGGGGGGGKSAPGKPQPNDDKNKH